MNIENCIVRKLPFTNDGNQIEKYRSFGLHLPIMTRATQMCCGAALGDGRLMVGLFVGKVGE